MSSELSFEQRSRNVERNRIYKYYSAVKLKKITAQAAIKSINELRSTLKFPDSVEFLEEAIKLLEDM